MLKVCRQSTIFNDLSIIVFILKIGSFLGRILPYFSSSQSNSTLLYSVLFSKSKPNLYLASAVWYSSSHRPRFLWKLLIPRPENVCHSQILLLDQRNSFWSFGLPEAVVSSGWWSPDLTNSENFPLDSSPAPSFSLPPKVYWVVRYQPWECNDREELCVLVMVGGPLPEPHITKQCWSVACKAAHPSPPVIHPGGNTGLIISYNMREHQQHTWLPHTSHLTPHLTSHLVIWWDGEMREVYYFSLSDKIFANQQQEAGMARPGRAANSYSCCHGKFARLHLARLARTGDRKTETIQPIIWWYNHTTIPGGISYTGHSKGRREGIAEQQS